jgi:outer membrane receptor protein involved in Fe transport
MHYPCLRPPFCPTVAAAVMAFAAAHAQTASSPAGANNEIVGLSPFEVRTERDKGFVAASSLAGGRLAGDLKDTPVAYSVLTKDFIDALQLTDLNEMAMWAPNSVSRSDMGTAGTSTGSDVTVTSRGVVSNNPQRNFFPYGFSFDSYNIDRLDLARGANSVLFGTGTSGGTANSVTKRARTDRRFTELRASAASWDNHRFTLDHNQPLGDRAALRFNAIYQDRQGWRDYDWEKKKAATLAATWKPFQHTEVRVEGEKGRRDRSVNLTNFNDQFTGWDGRSTFSAPITTAIAANGVARTAARWLVFTPTNGLGTVTNYEGWAMTLAGNATAATPVGGTFVVGPSANVSANPVNYAQNLPDARFNNALSGSHFRVPRRTDSGTIDAPLYAQDYDNVTLAVTQQVGERLFAEAAFNVGREKVDTNLSPARSLSSLLIDINSKLPNGAANPNYLEPYGETPAYVHNKFHETNEGRVSVGYVLDKTRLGDFRFNAIAGASSDTIHNDSFIYVFKDNADHRQWPTFNIVRFRYYYATDSSRPMPLADQVSYVDPVSGTTRNVPAGLVYDYTNTGFTVRSKTQYRYAQAAGNAKLFKGRLNLLGAVRRDHYESERSNLVERGDLPLTWDGTSYVPKPAAPADWGALIYRERNAAGNPIGPELPAVTRPRVGIERDARYANDRFQSDYSPEDASGTVDTYSVGAVAHVTKNITLFANYALSFVPPGNSYDINGKLFAPQASQGRDLGVRLVLLGGDLVANVIRYESKDKERTFSIGNFGTNLNAIIAAPPVGDTSGGLNTHGLALVPPHLDKAASESEGWELEVTANLNRNWRLMANAALPKAHQTDVLRGIRAYLATNDKVLRQILTEAGATISAANVATFNPAIPTSQSPRGPGAVAAWNNIQTDLASIVTQPQKLTRLTEAMGNFFTDYSFREGTLKGLRLGVGVNYRGREVIGYKGADTIRNPANGTQAIDDPAVGALDTVNRAPYATALLTFNYTVKLRGRYTLGFDLKIDNLFDYDKPLYYSTTLRPAGGDLTNPARVASGLRYYWVTPRNSTLAASLKF